MTNQSLCEYLFTQDPDDEVTIRLTSPSGDVLKIKIDDINGTEIIAGDIEIIKA